MHLPDNGRSYSIRALKKDSIIGHYESVLHYGLSSLETTEAIMTIPYQGYSVMSMDIGHFNDLLS
jgi:hypothetical protein